MTQATDTDRTDRFEAEVRGGLFGGIGEYLRIGKKPVLAYII